MKIRLWRIIGGALLTEALAIMAGRGREAGSR